MSQRVDGGLGLRVPLLCDRFWVGCQVGGQGLGQVSGGLFDRQPVDRRPEVEGVARGLAGRVETTEHVLLEVDRHDVLSLRDQGLTDMRPPMWAVFAGHALMMHFGAGRAGKGCHHFDDSFGPGTPRSADRVETAWACRTAAVSRNQELKRCGPGVRCNRRGGRQRGLIPCCRKPQSSKDSSIERVRSVRIDLSTPNSPDSSSILREAL